MTSLSAVGMTVIPLYRRTDQCGIGDARIVFYQSKAPYGGALQGLGYLHIRAASLGAVRTYEVGGSASVEKEQDILYRSRNQCSG